MKLTQNFTLEELTRSEKATSLGIKNCPDAEIIYNLKTLCEKILQPLRDKVGTVQINSAYRCVELNTAIGGVDTSQHVFGKAADIKTNNMKEAFHFIKDNLPFDQLIWEYGNSEQPAWIHVSYDPRNRKQVLRKEKGKRYQQFK